MAQAGAGYGPEQATGEVGGAGADGDRKAGEREWGKHGNTEGSAETQKVRVRSRNPAQSEPRRSCSGRLVGPRVDLAMSHPRFRVDPALPC